MNFSTLFVLNFDKLSDFKLWHPKNIDSIVVKEDVFILFPNSIFSKRVQFLNIYFVVVTSEKSNFEKSISFISFK